MDGLISALSTFATLAIAGFGGWTALQGIIEYSKAQGSGDGAAKTQAGGQIFGGVVIIFAGMAIVPMLFDLFKNAG